MQVKCVFCYAFECCLTISRKYSFSYLNRLCSPIVVIIFIAHASEIHSNHRRAPQKRENKICSTYKRKVKQPW